ncbi:hypothetical protein [Geodermatophilus marinus]|uniref:hypothetical protein n=1 Tax=Geodermatophilus sp. LHW52908 TaxID=2303986 RepID=UPI0018F2BB89|nr:hypothetical protein [Geodermatophilus sp. LHW52908]
MGLLSKLGKAGIAKKAIDEASKPQNQAKIKKLVSNLGNKGKGGAPRGRGRG